MRQGCPKKLPISRRGRPARRGSCPAAARRAARGAAAPGAAEATPSGAGGAAGGLEARSDGNWEHVGN